MKFLTWQIAVQIVILLVFATASPLAPLANAEATLAPNGAILVSEFIYTTAPFPSCHASTLAETRAGLVAAWFGGTGEGHNDVGIWFSRREKDAWTAPVEVANGVQANGQRHPCWNPVLYQAPAGPLHLFYKVGPKPSTWWGMHATSSNGGQTWSKPEPLPRGGIGPVKNKPLLLSDGRLLCGSSTEHEGWRLHFETLSADGKLWERAEPLVAPKEMQAIQPTLLQLPHGELQLLCRPGAARKILTARSTNNGKTWSPLAPTSLPNPGSGIDAVTLADGRHALIYNHSPFMRSPLNLALSSDGATWQAALVLEHELGEFSYPAIIQTSDGLIHISYTWKRTRIKHVAVDPAKLSLREMIDGKWPN